MNKLLIFGLLASLYTSIYSAIDPEIKKAVRKSFPEKLQLLLANHTLTQDERAYLLVQAGEVAKLNRKALENKDNYAQKKRANYIKLCLSGMGGVMGGLVVFSCIISLITKSSQSDLPSLISGTLILGGLGAISLKYSYTLYNKIKKFRPNKQKYLDALEVEQILTK